VLGGTSAFAQTSATWVGPTPQNNSPNQNWNTAVNWSTGKVPTSAVSAVIPEMTSGKYPVVQANSSFSCLNLSVAARASITIDGTLTVYGPLTDAGSIVINPSRTLATRNNVNVVANGSVTNNGTLSFSGTSASASTPLVFTNNGIITSSDEGVLVFTNARAVTLNGSGITSLSNVNFTTFGTGPLTLATTNYVDVRRVAKLNGSNVYSQGKLRLTSDANSTGILFNAGSGIVPDTIETQRYITLPAQVDPNNPSAASYRQYSAPVEGAKFSMFKKGTSFVPIYDNPANRYQYPNNDNPNPYPSIYDYSQDELSRSGSGGPGNFNWGWRGVTEGTLMELGRGYSVYISALNTANGSPNTVSVRGIPHTGDLESPNYGRGDYAESGFQMVGNPYPGFVSMYDVTQDNLGNGFDQIVYKFRPQGLHDGIYEPYDPGDGSDIDGINQYFPMMQAFFVRKTDPSILTPYQFHDTQRLGGNGYPTESNARPFYRTAQAAIVPTVGLLLADTNQPDLRDEVRVSFRPDATIGHDVRYDAVRPGDNMGENPTFFSINATQEKCSRNALPTLKGTVNVPLGLHTLVAGRSYSVRVDKLTMLAKGQVFLEDRQTGKVQDIVTEPIFTFKADQAAYEHRFFLRFEEVPTATELMPAFEIYPNPVGADRSLQFSARGLAMGTATATLFTSYGAEVLNKPVTVSGDGLILGELSLTGLNSGIYILRFTSGNTVITRRVEVR
jgi:hypothetical protein